MARERKAVEVEDEKEPGNEDEPKQQGASKMNCMVGMTIMRRARELVKSTGMRSVVWFTSSHQLTRL
ncbi:hypothetical protein EmuJ_000560200 [Echinococcus multilocularis]|uniref:Uncharacterized protein n=1 Tax=Echinococcus multilocularis TaxID=6211 RepID=U6HHX4_ECHMU|nr:hypothetical protein EmuJ_000409200 [Echinococcus multilocularis]CDS36580.1 hypothetical protein EmuJ_000371500 [Echinococcus multilocularis]CDS36799.1 hypothetical protein EmuJ_000397100 [Echinococcus multilocularis]CDS38249.1 hypothetical protein EmuJ_000560200 [Echinococcus multilocularis]